MLIHYLYLAWGVEYTFGILLDGLMEAFGTSYSSTSGVFSVQMVTMDVL